MMKRLLPFSGLLLYVCFAFASIADEPETVDGYLTEGEYLGGGITLEYDEELFVIGGGGDRIEARDHGYLEVQYTSTPLGIDVGGIMDIFLYDNSELLYLGGITEEITVRDDATAVLKGGRIDYITIYDHPSYSHEVVIYCRADYQMNASGISGLWADGTSFDIEFIDVGTPYPPTWQGIDIEIVPEPATLTLLGLGGLFAGRKR